MNGIEMKAEETGRPVIEKLGYELVETQYKDIYGNPTLTFFIYKKGGVTLDDCEAVSNALDGVMDENDVTDGKFYHLNVSSLGLDRPILTDDDFRRNIGEDVELIFVEKIGKKKKTHGILVSYDGEKITITENGTRKASYDRKNLGAVRPYIGF
jgi:ribosome maturation factor RimP